MWTIHARFRIGSYLLPEIDITPALGISLIVAVVFLVGKTTMGV